VFIVTAWQQISPEVTVKSFKKCCIPSAVDGTDGEVFFNLLIKACPITLGNTSCRVNLVVHQEVSYAVSLYIV